MTASDVSKSIEAEILGRWDLTNAHGVNLKRCLVTPKKKIFVELMSNEQIELWLVLEEDPETKGGYQIVFDEQTKRYGLATTDVESNQDCFLGFYGTFLETLEAM